MVRCDITSLFLVKLSKYKKGWLLVSNCSRLYSLSTACNQSVWKIWLSRVCRIVDDHSTRDILGKQTMKYQKTINISHLFSFVSALSWQDFNSSGSQRSSEELKEKLKERAEAWIPWKHWLSDLGNMIIKLQALKRWQTNQTTNSICDITLVNIHQF